MGSQANYIKSNIKYLHIIRGFAAFFVVLAHAKWPFWIGGTAYFAENKFGELSIIDKVGSVLALLSSNGTAMVIVFFVLSGFMISYSYAKNNWSYKDFLVNRSLRIYVPYIISMFLAGLVLYIAGSTTDTLFINNPKDYNSNVELAFKEGFNLENFLITLGFYRIEANYFGFNYVYWSLLYEAIFYLLFPLIFRNIKTFFIISLLLHPLHFFINLAEMPYFLVFFFTKFLLYFTSGVLLFKALQNDRFFQYNHPLLSKKSLTLLLLGVCLGGIIGIGLVLNKSISFLFSILFAAIWVFYLLKYGAGKSLLAKVMIFLGKVSYSLYLIHVPLLLLFYTVLYKVFHFSIYQSPWVHMLFALLTLPFAYLFYQGIEVYSMKLIEKHKRKIQNKEDNTPVNDIPLPAEISIDRN
jgi:peptidoglycan/LPS O-acetylase OafA/YrhL